MFGSASIDTTPTVVVNVICNKVQLIKLICDNLPEAIQRYQLHEDCRNNFVPNDSSPTHIQVDLGVIMERKDLDI